EGRIEKVGDVAGREDIGHVGPEQLVHDDAVLDTHAGLLSELDVRLNAQTGHDDVGRDVLAVRRAHDDRARALVETGQALPGADIDALFAVVIDQKLGEIGRKYARADALLGHDHGDFPAHHPERRGDFRPDESTPQDRKTEL